MFPVCIAMSRTATLELRSRTEEAVLRLGRIELFPFVELSHDAQVTQIIVTSEVSPPNADIYMLDHGEEFYLGTAADATMPDGRLQIAPFVQILDIPRLL